MKTAFKCHSQGCYVVCEAPCRCNHDCHLYHAHRVSGVETRKFTCDTDKHCKITLKSGFIRGHELVLIEDKVKLKGSY